MVEPLTIFGGIGTAIALLDLARRGFLSLMKISRELPQVGRNLEAIGRRFKNACYIIEKWCTDWGLEKIDDETIMTGYWGEEGWKLIRNQLAAIDNGCEHLAAIMGPYHSNIGHLDIELEALKDARARLRERARKRARNSRRKLSHTRKAFNFLGRIFDGQEIESIREREIERLQILMEHLSSNISIRKKIKFVLSACEALEGFTKALEADIDKLTSLAMAAWRSEHPTMDINTSDPKMKLTQGLCRKYEWTLVEAKKDREETRALHTCCSKNYRVPKLEMNLLEDASGTRCCKRFYMFVPWNDHRTPGPSTHIEVCVEFVGTDNPINSSPSSTFIDACAKAEGAKHSVFYAWLDSKPDQAMSRYDDKRYWKLHRALSTQDGKMLSLRVKLSRISLAERLKLAWRVVESSLLLLGTSWLSALDSTNLVRLRDNGNHEPRYILNVKDNNPSTIRRKLVSMVDREDGIELEPYTFVIGVLLIEIAFQDVIDEIRYCNSRIELGVRSSGSQILQWASLSRIVDQVKKEMGVDYSEAVCFCLQDPTYALNREWRQNLIYDRSRHEEDCYLQLLDLFYDKVFIK